MRRFRNKSTDFATAEKMCFNYFSSSVKTLVSLWMFSCLFDIALGQCRGEADIICKDIGSADEHRNALISAFSGNHEIDLIFIICNTTDCTKAYSKVISFIVNLVALVSTKYDSYIDADRLHIAMIVYDNTSARVTLNDIKETIPKVGNCEFDKFLNNSMASYEARGTTDGLLTESLKEANTVFSQSARSKARKILWLFSDCRCCGPELCGNDNRQEVKNAVGDIKRGNLNNVFVFTGGITPCAGGGWFHRLSQEDTMKTIATNNASHYACIDEWIEFTNTEISLGTSQPWSEINKDVDIGGSCRECANSTSSTRCGCQVSSKEYMCHEPSTTQSTSNSTTMTTTASIYAGPSTMEPPLSTEIVQGSTDNRALAIGLGIGIPLVLVILALSVGITLMKKKLSYQTRPLANITGDADVTHAQLAMRTNPQMGVNGTFEMVTEQSTSPYESFQQEETTINDRHYEDLIIYERRENNGPETLEMVTEQSTSPYESLQQEETTINDRHYQDLIISERRENNGPETLDYDYELVRS